MNRVRIDKWLWAARFFKTRALASRACELGRIKTNDQPVKASREVRVGDKLAIRNEGGEYHVEVLVVTEMRGPASIAQTLYQESEESRAARLKLAEERKNASILDLLHDGRPSKRDRRDLDRLRGRL